MHSPEMDDDNASVISFGTTDKAINSIKHKDLVEDVEDIIRPHKKRSREDFIDGFIPDNPRVKRPDNRPEGMGVNPFGYHIVSARGLDDAEDAEGEAANDEDADIEKELDKEDIQKVLPEFIEVMIAAPRKRIRALMKHLPTEDRGLKDLINEFFLGSRQVTKEIEDALRALKTSSTTVEINNILNEVEDMNNRFKDILKRLNDTDDQLAVVKRLKQEQKISESAYAKLVDKLETDDLSLPIIVGILKEHPNRKDKKIGQGVVYLPASVEGLREKFCLLAAEYKAGNTTTRNELVAVIDELRRRDLITEKQYIGCNDWLNEEEEGEDFALKICDKLAVLAKKYDTGDRSVGPEIVKCAEELEDRCVAARDCREVRDKIHEHQIM